jgi:hypothetical protein
MLTVRLLRDYLAVHGDGLVDLVVLDGDCVG